MEEKTKKAIISNLKDFGEVIIAVIIVFGVMYLILGPPFPPIVVVISESMLHSDDSWKQWFGEHKLNYSSFSFIDGFDKGDIIITKHSDSPNLGDVIIYDRDKEHLYPRKEGIIHRVVGMIEIRNWSIYNYTGTLDCITNEMIEEDIEHVKACNENPEQCIYPKYPKKGDFKFYITKGDHNSLTDQCGLMPDTPMHLIPETQVVTNGWILIPKIGYIKIWFNDAIDFITGKK